MVNSTSSPGPGTAITDTRSSGVSVSTNFFALFITLRAAPVRMLPWSISSTISRPLGAPLAFEVEKVSSATTTLRGAPICAQRIGGADVFDGGDLPLVAIDLDLEIAGGQVGYLAPVAVERGDVDRHELDAGAENWDPGGLGWVLGAQAATSKARRRSVMFPRASGAVSSAHYNCRDMSVRDVLIIGAGPSGLATAIAAKHFNLDYLVLEQGALVDAIARFPINMVFFTTPELLEIGGIPLTTPFEKPTRAEALRYYRKVVDTFQLQVSLFDQVISIHPPECA